MYFKNTQEAVFFGKDATKEEQNQLKTQRAKLLTQYKKFLDDDDLRNAMKMAVQAQLCREALCANTALELISIWNIKKEE